MATLKELLEGRELPVKVTNKNLYEGYYIVTHKNNNSCLTTTESGRDDGWSLSSNYWELYEEPKKKVKVALYAYRESGDDQVCITFSMYKNDDDFLRCISTDTSLFKRLDWSETEIDED